MGVDNGTTPLDPGVSSPRVKYTADCPDSGVGNGTTPTGEASAHYKKRKQHQYPFGARTP